MSDMTEEMADEIAAHNQDAKILDGHANAIIGMVQQNGSDPVVLYDPLKIIHNLVVEGSMTQEEAEEFYNFNIAGAYVGKNTPMMIIRLDSLGAYRESNVEKGDA
jgi:hypothetical protein